MRPIDADALRNKRKNAIINTHERYGCEVVEYIEIINAPTLSYKDLVPQGAWERYADDKFIGYDKDGRLKYRKVYTYECSVCRNGSAVKSNFCPNCGARMTK